MKKLQISLYIALSLSIISSGFLIAISPLTGILSLVVSLLSILVIWLKNIKFIQHLYLIITLSLFITNTFVVLLLIALRLLQIQSRTLQATDATGGYYVLMYSAIGTLFFAENVSKIFVLRRLQGLIDELKARTKNVYSGPQVLSTGIV